MARGKHRRPEHQKYVYQDYIQAPPPVAAYPPVPYEPKPVVNIDVLGAKNATVARVTLAKHKDWTAAGTVFKFEAAESAKREQGDVSDPLTGELLALGRAFQRLSRDLFREGHKRVRKAAEEKAAAEEAAEAKARHLPVEVHRRTREEWEAIQQQRYEKQGGKFNLKRIQTELDAAAAATAYNPELLDNATVKYNPRDAELLTHMLGATARTAAEEKQIAELKARRDELNVTLRLLGENG